MGNNSVIVKDFLQPEQLAKEIKNYSVLILPSLQEPWALVIHEALASGLSVIATNVCGAVPVFLIDGYNGFIIEQNNIDALRVSIEKIVHSSNEQLSIMGENAYTRSHIITPEIAAATLMSLLKK